MTKFRVTVPAYEIYEVEAESLEDAYDLVWSGDIEPDYVDYSGGTEADEVTEFKYKGAAK
jgi:hypothetical protein